MSDSMVDMKCPRCDYEMDAFKDTESLDGLISDGTGFRCPNCYAIGSFGQYGDGELAQWIPSIDEADDEEPTQDTKAGEK